MTSTLSNAYRGRFKGQGIPPVDVRQVGTRFALIVCGPAGYVVHVLSNDGNAVTTYTATHAQRRTQTNRETFLQACLVAAAL